MNKLHAKTRSLLFGLLPWALLMPRPVLTVLTLALLCIEAPNLPRCARQHPRAAILWAAASVGLIGFLAVRFGPHELGVFLSNGDLAAAWFLIPAGILAVFAASHSNPEYALRARKALVRSSRWAAITMGAFGIAQFFGFMPTTVVSVYEQVRGAPIYRVTGLQPHATAFGISSILLLTLATLSYVASRSRAERVLSAAGIVALSLSTAATLGRAAFLGIILLGLLLSASLAWSARASILRFLARKKMLAGGAAAALLISITLIGSLRPANPVVKRISELSHSSGAHGERLLENLLGMKIFLENPLGAGSTQIPSLWITTRETDPAFNRFSWEFESWRGVHNGFLHAAVLWGIPGLFAYILALSFVPAVTLAQSRSADAGPIAIWSSIAPAAVLFAYSLTDSVFYFENAAGLILVPPLGLWITRSIDKDSAERRSPVASLILVITPFAFLALSALRMSQIESMSPVTLYFDNPGPGKKAVRVLPFPERWVDEGAFLAFHLPEGEWQVTVRGADTGFPESTFTLRTRLRDPTLGRDQILYPLETGTPYELVRYEYSNGKVSRRSSPVAISTRLRPIEFPREAIASGAEFAEPAPTSIERRFRLDADGNATVQIRNPIVARSGWAGVPEIQCWEPAWVGFSGRWDLDPCGGMKGRRQYGLGVIRWVFRFLEEAMSG